MHRALLLAGSAALAAMLLPAAPARADHRDCSPGGYRYDYRDRYYNDCDYRDRYDRSRSRRDVRVNIDVRRGRVTIDRNRGGYYDSGYYRDRYYRDDYCYRRGRY
jgi:hypothetical protein